MRLGLASLPFRNILGRHRRLGRNSEQIRRARRRSSRLRLGREETLEDPLGLPARRVRKIDPHVHAAGTRERRVETVDVVRRRKEESAFGSCDAVEAVEQPAKGER